VERRKLYSLLGIWLIIGIFSFSIASFFPLSSPSYPGEFKPQRNVSNLKGAWVKSYFWFNGMTNTSWDFALSDVVQAQESGTENRFTDDGADSYGYAQEQVSFNVPVNAWIEIKITEMWDGGDSNFAGSMQMHIGGAWEYNLLDWDWSNGTDIYLTANMSTFNGDAVAWQMYNMHDGSDGNSYYVLDYFAWFTYSYEPVWNDVLDETVFQMETPPLPVWHDVVDEQVFEMQTPLFLGYLDAFIILLGLCLIPISTVYLAVNKDDMDSDKLLLGLVLMVIGWALFFGGII